MNIIDNFISSILEHNTVKPLTVSLLKPRTQLALHRELQHYAASSDGCGGYTGHCSCLNNPCMICSNAH